ncbi:MAG TPA: T9SS type A sorting domain-containing protein [Bacteroidia bacterium]|nr:T9SS type A sorting domain-containing protein [Bacteroidia bacterium]
MKKLLLVTLSLVLCEGTFAQNGRNVKSITDLKPLPNDHAVPYLESSLDAVLPLRQFDAAPPSQQAKTTNTNIVIGNTTYDLQSNGTSIAHRVYKNGSTLGAAWTYSTDLGGTYPDRGTGVNNSSNNGASWGPLPTARAESERRGFGALDKLGAGECVVSHVSATDSVAFYSRPTAGTGAWTKVSYLPGPGANLQLLWPSMCTGGPNGNSVHVVAVTAPTGNGGAYYNGQDPALIYNRSTDGGATWDIVNSQLPGSDATLFTGFRANGYAIDADGDVIAIVAGNIDSDWVLWKSMDNGNTWTKTIIFDFPFTNYDDSTMITDVNGDLIADTLETTDGAYAVVIDHNDVVHCFAGGMTIIDETDVGLLGLFLSTNGLLYWNENMGSSLPEVIAESEDLNGDLTLTFGADLGGRYGNDGICSMPTAGVDFQNNVYVAYASLKDNTTNGATPEFSYRNVYCKASGDGGLNWNPQFNVFNDDFTELVFPSMAREVNAPGCFHLIWQQDASPGYSVPPNGEHAIGSNDIMYSCIDPITELGITVGINENNNSTLIIQIAPNPASDFVKLSYNFEQPEFVKINVTNVFGQSVYQNEKKMVPGTNNVSIDLRNFSSGVYFVNSAIGETTYTSKFVIE